MRATLYTFILGLVFLAPVSAREKSDSIKQYDLDAFEFTVKEKAALSTEDNQEYSLQLKSVEQLPQLMGSTDAIRTLQLLPGVQTTGDASSGLYIEGCNPSQNLILLDNAPVFNPIHLGGFFSVFNNDHFDDFRLQKNFISAEYGGRLASVLTVNSKEYIPQKTEGDVNISFLLSNATVRIPINKKSDITASGRFSYVNPTIEAISRITGKERSLNYDFNDINLSYFYSSLKDEWKLSLYTGRDKAKINMSEKTISGNLWWSNLASSLNWKHKINKNQLNQTLYYSSYDDDFSMIMGETFEAAFLSSLKEIGYKGRFTGEVKAMKYNVGADYLYRFSIPQYIDVSYFSEQKKGETENTSEAGLYAELSYSFTKKLKAVFGLRGSIYFYKDSLSDIRTFLNCEPRFNLNYDAAKSLNFSLSAQQQVQYLNQVMNSTIGFPTNFWIQASDEVPYQKSQSVSLGVTKQLFDDKYGILGNLFYRKLYNQFESTGYIVELLEQNLNRKDRYREGDGDNYGIEILFQKKQGAFIGWIAYTLSWTWRKFDEFEKRVPSINDRRHDLNIVLSYNKLKNWNFSASFVLASGTPTTFSEGVYLMGEMPMNYYAKYNSNRLPNYHHLDISATKNLNIKYFKESKLNISIYNVYGRLNPILFTSELTYHEQNKDFKANGFYHSLFTILPSVGLKLSW